MTASPDPAPPSGTRSRDPMAEARTLFEQGWHTKARRAAEATVREAPNYAPAHLLLARIALAQGALPRAQSAAERAVQAEPNHAGALAALGECHLRAGRAALAAETLKKSLEAAPDDPIVLGHLGFANQALGMPEEAISSYRMALDITPDSALLHYNVATALKQVSHFDEAITHYQRAAELSPQDASLHTKLGVTLNENGRFDEAVTSFDRALEITPNDAGSLSQLAYARMKLAQGAQSTEAARRLLALSPDHLGAQLVLARSLLTDGAMAEALTVLEEAQTQAPDNRAAFADKAIVLAELGRVEEARAIADLDALLDVSTLPVPEGFASIEEFNSALVQHMRGHPTLNLSTNSLSCHHGHTSDELLVEPKGPVALLEQALYDAAHKYRHDRETSEHPYPAMLPDEWRLSAWTTTLERQGYQHGHIHATAHLSGVYYLSLPDVVADDTAQAGWIEFGRAPDYYQAQNQGDVRTIKPAPGLLLLFPSYLYHRTIPFDSDQPRITIAFDFRRPGIAPGGGDI